MSIGEVASRCGVATSAIRFYEERGLISSTRSAGNQRRFSRDVIRRIAFITAAQAVGRSLEEISVSLRSLPNSRTPTTADWGAFATSWRPRLDEHIAKLIALRDKLDGCIGCGCLSIERCAIYNEADMAAVRGPGPRYLLGDDPN